MGQAVYQSPVEPRPRKAFRSLAAFSLVELLVVIGVIAILIAILIPVLQGARQAAQSTRCLANLQQLGQGIHMYASESRGFVVPAKREDQMGGAWCDILSYYRYVKAPQFRPSRDAPIPPNYPDLEPLLGPSPFSCPSQGNTQFPGMTWTDNKNPLLFLFIRRELVETSYAVNGCAYETEPYRETSLRFPFRNHWFRGSLLGSNVWDTRLPKLAQFRRASDTAMICDGVDRVGMVPQQISARHARRTRTNFLFADGRAASVESASLPRTYWDMVDVKRLSTFKPVVWRSDQP